MLHLTLANLRAKPGRFVATMLAIIVGTGLPGRHAGAERLAGPGARVQRRAWPSRASTPRCSPSSTPVGGRRRNQTLSSSSVPAVAAGHGDPGAAASRPRPAPCRPSSTCSAPTAPCRSSTPTARCGSTSPALSPYKIVTGRAPTAAGQIAIDQQTADAKHWGVGTAPRAGHVVGLAPSHRGRRSAATARARRRAPAVTSWSTGRRLRLPVLGQAPLRQHLRAGRRPG